MVEKKTVIIDGNKFSDLEEFWDYVKQVFGYRVNYFGRNFNAFDEFLYGGFGPFEDDEDIVLIWNNFKKSEKELKKKDMAIIVEVIESHKDHIEFLKQ